MLAAFNADGAEGPEPGPDCVGSGGAAGGASLGEIPAEPKPFFQKYGMMIAMLAFNLIVQSLTGGAKAKAAAGKEGEGEPARVAAAGATTTAAAS